MDEVTKQFIIDTNNQLVDQINNSIRILKNDVYRVEDETKNNIKSTLDEFRKEVNSRFDKVDKEITQIFEIVTANGQGIETISGRLDKVEIRI